MFFAGLRFTVSELSPVVLSHLDEACKDHTVLSVDLQQVQALKCQTTIECGLLDAFTLFFETLAVHMPYAICIEQTSGRSNRKVEVTAADALGWVEAALCWSEAAELTTINVLKTPLSRLDAGTGLHAIFDSHHLGFVGAKPHMFRLPVSGAECAKMLAEDAALLTGGGTAVFPVPGDWWVVACEVDWLSGVGCPRVEEAFKRILVFPEQGQNSVRSEVLLKAFAKTLVTSKGGERLVINGNVGERDAIWDAMLKRGHKRHVAFRIG